MSLAVKICVLFMAGTGAVHSTESSSHRDRNVTRVKRPVTVADTIRMTRIGGPANSASYAGFGPREGITFVSPDGRRVAMVLRQGNLKNNTNIYSLWVFGMREIVTGGHPRLLIKLASSSNSDAISRPVWLDDNDTIAFLGARRSEKAQVYSIRCSTGHLSQLTHHPTALSSYAITPDGRTIAYTAERPEQAVITRASLRSGLWIDRENPADLIRGQITNNTQELYVRRYAESHEDRLSTSGQVDDRVQDLGVSPDGRYVLIKTNAVKIPDLWREYDDPWIRAALHRKLPQGFPSRIAQYELFDLEAGKRSLLLNAPVSYSPSVAVWSSDSTSLIVSGVHLPLDVQEPAERDARRVHTYTVEICLPALTTRVITNENLVAVSWSSPANVVSFRRAGESECREGKRASVWFEETAGGWKQRAGGLPGVSNTCPQITVEQSLNVPARITVRNERNGRTSTVFDLNPQFSDIAFASIELLSWPDGSGGIVEGGLYLPRGYLPGKRYPLVIQTHGFDPNAFWIEGPHTTAYAAQPIASHGIAVLQINDIFYDSLVTPAELDRVMRAYEQAIDELDQRGIIDPHRVGLVGFSRTGMYVKYALTHSRKSFAAAVVADANDAGYLQYLLNGPFAPGRDAEMDAMFGTGPFGEGLKVWLQKSPGFLLDRVKAPVLIEALGPLSLLEEWEWFSGLKRLEKPVDLVYLPTGTHLLVKPWDRQVSLEGTLDWLCFWLTGEEDKNPQKRAQYRRWHGLKLRASGS